MDQSLLKTCLNNEFYNDNKAKLRADIFEDTTKEIYETITSMHDKFEADISSADLFSFWKSQNPTSTQSWTDEIKLRFLTIR